MKICGTVLATMVELCLIDDPVESCGVVTALAGDETADSQDIWPMRNALRSKTAYAFEEGDQLAVWRRMEHLGQVPVMIYHSHTASAPEPSQKDLRWATEPNAVYVIVQTAPRPDQCVVRGWKIEFGGGAYAEERLELGCCWEVAPVDPSKAYQGKVG